MCQERWPIGTDGEIESKESILSARFDDDDKLTITSFIVRAPCSFLLRFCLCLLVAMVFISLLLRAFLAIRSVHSSYVLGWKTMCIYYISFFFFFFWRLSFHITPSTKRGVNDQRRDGIQSTLVGDFRQSEIILFQRF